MLLVWAWVERRRILTVVKPAVLILLGAGMILIPWIVRNSLLHEQLVLSRPIQGKPCGEKTIPTVPGRV